MPASPEVRAQTLADKAAKYLVATRVQRIMQRRDNGERLDSAERSWERETQLGFRVNARDSSEVSTSDKRFIEIFKQIETVARQATRGTAGTRGNSKRDERTARRAFTSELAKAIRGISPNSLVRRSSHWDAMAEAVRSEEARSTRMAEPLGGSVVDGFVDQRVAFDVLLATKFWFNIDANFEIETPQKSLS